MMFWLLVTSLPWLSLYIQACPINCTCNHDILHCHGDKAPSVIPNNTREVYLNGFYFVAENIHPFEDKSWQNVCKLAINARYVNATAYLANKSFIGLWNLTYLGFHGVKGLLPSKVPYFTFYENSLYGLKNLKTLNISENYAIHFDNVLIMLRKDDIVPKLEYLLMKSLSKIHGEIINLDSKFFNILSKKNIKGINLDDTSFSLNLASMLVICNTLESLSIRRATVPSVTPSIKECPSLTTLDLTNANIPELAIIMSLNFTKDMFTPKNFNTRMGYLFAIKNLFMNNVAQKPIRFDRAIVFNASGVHLQTNNLQFRKNKLTWFNATIKKIAFPPHTEMDFSFNDIAYIHPKSVDPADGITNLDLSHNKLNIMEKERPGDFAEFLKIFHDLEKLNISENGIESIPEHMFANNIHLLNLDIGRNKIKTVSFELKHLTNLKHLNLNRNQITHLEPSQMEKINEFVNNYSSRHQGEQPEINLGGNMFVCSCEDIRFIEWVSNSSFLVEMGDLYTCKFEEDIFNMKTNALLQIVRICNHRKLILTVEILSSCGFVLLLLLCIGIILRIKQERKRNKIHNYLQNLQDTDYLVFLSNAETDSTNARAFKVELNKKLKEYINYLKVPTQNREPMYVCSAENIVAGHNLLNETSSLFESSAVVVCLLSRSYCEDDLSNMVITEVLRTPKHIINVFIENDMENINATENNKAIQSIYYRKPRFEITGPMNGECLEAQGRSICKYIIEFAANR